jgi:DNA-binding NarL/FixJ family response regulator
MNKIQIAIFDSRQYITLEGIEALLLQKDDFEVIIKSNSTEDMFIALKTVQPNILIANLYKSDKNGFELVKKLGLEYPRIKILILSMEFDKDLLFKTMKAGAKGFLTSHSTSQEIFEAIHHLRNGYDYFNKSITEVLVKDYIKIIKSEEEGKVKNLQNLSKREIEIIRYWGDGHTNQEIADKLFISVRTVESHKNHIMQKLNLRTSVDLVKFAIKNNLIQV